MSEHPDPETMRSAWVLLALTVLAYLLVIANPGFYSHDEWQKVDFIREHGWAAFAKAHGGLVAGPEFGYPVRPIGFLQQGLSATWMTRAPVLPHLVDVLMHALTVLLFWRVLLAAGVRAGAARMAAAVLAVSPLATFSTGWVAASFDRWYALFFLVAALGWIRAMRAWSPTGALLVLAGSAGAILSKETALVLPGALLVVGWVMARQGMPWPSRTRLAVMLACASLPIAIYLAVRLPALQATLAGGPGPYSPSPSFIPGNALRYFAYPFVPAGVETLTLSLLPRWHFVLGFVAHLALVAALVRRRGPALAAAYLAGYFVFLLPVLVLPITGAHYLYGPGLAFALGCAAALSPRAVQAGAGVVAPTTGRGLLLASMALLAVLAARSVWIQQAMYSEGRCQSEFLASYEPLAEAAIATGARRVVLGAAPGTRDYVATKVLFGRSQFSEQGRWPTIRGASAERAGDAAVVMLPDCRAALAAPLTR